MIQTRDLSKSYKDVLALDHLNLDVGAAEVFGYIGPNGAGKTTTIRILSGLLRPSSGAATIDGVDIVRHPRQAKNLVGYLPDEFGVYSGMRVWEYLDFYGAAYKIPRADRLTRIEEVLATTGIETMRDYYVDTLSHGMQKRVGIAKTLIHNPKVLFLDEPTSGLDPRARIEIRELLKVLRGHGKTVLVSSHILPELASICDRIGIIERGQLLVCDRVEEVMKQVQQQRVIDIELLSDVEAARAFLQERHGAQAVDIQDRTGRLLRIALEGDDDAAAALLKDLVGAGHRVVWQTEVTMDLEQVYLKVTEAAQAGTRRLVDHG